MNRVCFGGIKRWLVLSASKGVEGANTPKMKPQTWFTSILKSSSGKKIHNMTKK
jgi:hypothetical protein